MKIPIVKEWGSWAVFGSSCLVAIILGLLNRPWETGREFLYITVSTVLGMLLLINSKNPLTSIVRTKRSKKEHILWFLFFSISGLIFMIPFLQSGIKEFAIFSILIASYTILLLRGKEHHIITELNGFALLTLSAPIAYFAVTGETSIKLYFAVTMFFAAGVLKVRVRLKKNLFFRSVMILYCGVVTAIFYFMQIPLIILLPLIENIISTLWLREEKLKTTGNIELTKSIVFVILMSLFWDL